MPDLQPGPCQICGHTNYPLSLGGPGICPTCDCGGLKPPQVRTLMNENTILRGIVAKLNAPCHYCGVDNMGKCPHGFPGCALADDLFCAEDETFKRVVAERNELKKQAEDLKKQLACANENFHVTNKAWVERDKEVTELKRQVETFKEVARVSDVSGENYRKLWLELFHAVNELRELPNLQNRCGQWADVNTAIENLLSIK